jgi:hypothetical protein
MADQNPTGGPRVVPINLPPAQTEILRDELLGWLAGIEEDLETEQLPDPGADAREADASVASSPRSIVARSRFPTRRLARR